VQQALSKITSKVLVTGIESDLLFPVEEQLLLTRYLNGATFKLIDSPYGHDGFLIETKQLKEQLNEFINLKQ
jgi:homoserine O-acetyltransferase